MLARTSNTSIRRTLAAALILSPLLLLGRAYAADDTSLAFQPAAVQAEVGGTAEMSLALNSTSAIQGADVQFGFNSAVLTVVDADGVTNGVQVSPGTCPTPDFVVVNAVNNASGTGQYAAVEFTTSCTAGDVFSVTFSCLVEGSSPIVIIESTLSDPNGIAVPHSVFEGTVNCISATNTPTATSTGSATATATQTATPTGTPAPPSPTATTTSTPPSATPTATSVPGFWVYLPIMNH